MTYISDFLPKLWALRLIYAIFLMFSPLLAFLLLFFVCKQCFGKRGRSEKGGEGKLYYIRISPSRSEYHSAESRISHCRNTPAARRIQQKARQMLGGRKTVICKFLGAGMISVMPVPLLSVHPRECSQRGHIRYVPSACACRWTCRVPPHRASTAVKATFAKQFFIHLYYLRCLLPVRSQTR